MTEKNELGGHELEGGAHTRNCNQKGGRGQPSCALVGEVGRGERPIFCIYARLLPAPRPATHQIPLDRNSPSPSPPRTSLHPPATALRVHPSMPGTGGREGGEEGEEEVLKAEGARRP